MIAVCPNFPINNGCQATLTTSQVLNQLINWILDQKLGGVRWSSEYLSCQNVKILSFTLICIIFQTDLIISISEIN